MIKFSSYKTSNRYHGILLGILTSADTLFVAQEILYSEDVGLHQDHKANSPYWLNFAERLNYAYIRVDPIVYHQFGQEKSLTQKIDSFALSAIPGDYIPEVKYIRCLASLWMQDNTILVYKVKVNNAKSADFINWQSAEPLKGNQNVKLAARISLYASIDRPIEIDFDHPHIQTVDRRHDDEASHSSVNTGDQASNQGSAPTTKKNIVVIKNLEWRKPLDKYHDDGSNKTVEKKVELIAQKFTVKNNEISTNSKAFPHDDLTYKLTENDALCISLDLRAQPKPESIASYSCEARVRREPIEVLIPQQNKFDIHKVQFGNEGTVVTKNNRAVFRLLNN